MARPLNKIAAEILTDWGPQPPKGYQVFARPYVIAMLDLKSITDCYGVDPADDIVIRFLTNAVPWRGDTARRIKLELNTILKEAKCT